MPDDSPNTPQGQAPSDNDVEAPGTASPDVASAASPASSSDAPASDAVESEEGKAQRERQKVQLQKKAEFLLDLLKRFDTLIYAQLAFLYYLEFVLPPNARLRSLSPTNKVSRASLPRVLIRLFAHINLLSPSALPLPSPIPGQKPYTQGVLFSNLLVIAVHTFFSLPQPHNGARGYMHGGIWPDFIGQRPPTTRSYLLGMDILIMALQFVMLAVKEQEGRVKTALKGRREMDEYLAQERRELRGGRDSETAEQGHVGRVPEHVSEEEERQSLMASLTDEEGRFAFPARPPARTVDSEEEDEEEGREEPVYGPEGGPLDEYVSGNLILGEFHVIHTAKELWKRISDREDQSLMAAGYTAGYHIRRAHNRVTAAANAAGV